MKLRPIGKRVVIKPKEISNATNKGIVLPDNRAKSKPNIGVPHSGTIPGGPVSQI